MNDRAIKVRIYPSKVQREFLSMNFGCCRFVYNEMLKERKEAYQLYKGDKKSLLDHERRTEKDYKKLYPFLKEADSKCVAAISKEFRDCI